MPIHRGLKWARRPKSHKSIQSPRNAGHCAQGHIPVTGRTTGPYMYFLLVVLLFSFCVYLGFVSTLYCILVTRTGRRNRGDRLTSHKSFKKLYWDRRESSWWRRSLSPVKLDQFVVVCIAVQVSFHAFKGVDHIAKIKLLVVGADDSAIRQCTIHNFRSQILTV